MLFNANEANKGTIWTDIDDVNTQIKFDNVQFISNVAKTAGAGAALTSENTVTYVLTNENYITTNQSRDSGAVFLKGDSVLDVHGKVYIVQNKSAASGGAKNLYLGSDNARITCSNPQRNEEKINWKSIISISADTTNGGREVFADFAPDTHIYLDDTTVQIPTLVSHRLFQDEPRLLFLYELHELSISHLLLSL